ncbi:quinone-dependent dihydroorotate dehydrogenase [Kocuria sp. JC486]|uniref:quinone-dependent dihydroorotate dehydrogenase n=1 Tax=Kocuria sp. JC486 TaxID=1970736 RepID=UPI00142282D4|nr:quinone-dependent dihydroorotate dehydrogenase [Kocuria sp. JC486]NHU84078.1 quinone-dependent dihydroorotate dehydrogenase [Kocuria sp. JC486]
MRVYPTFFTVCFSWMDPERAHHLGFLGIKTCRRLGLSSVLRRLTRPAGDQSVEVMGLRFPSRFGLAAGFDKGAKGIPALADLGFGHVEIGTVTGQPQPGNPRPRLFRLVRDKAVINRMGFNNDGAAAVAPRVRSARAALARDWKGRTRPVIGVNIGKTKVVPLEDAVADYRSSTRELAPCADYLVVNVSSPNTPGLRELQAVESLRPILAAVREESSRVTGRRVPLLVKIAPDLADADVLAVADLAMELGLDGIVATNTTIAREGLGLVTDPAVVESYGAGGLSGVPLRARSLEVLRTLKAHVGDRLALVAVGGVTSAEDAGEALAAGADLVQGYTAFLYEGPFWAARVVKGLRRLSRV